jgi:predicted nucleotidyltransferase
MQDNFLKLLNKIEPLDSDRRAYQKHRRSITSRLKSAFEAHRVELIGSFKRETAIRGFSDIDLMLILSGKEVARGDGWKSSTTVLKHVRDQLQDRYWNTAVGVDKQAVVVSFSDHKHPVDVVPAIYQGLDSKNRYAIYAIPDGEGWWMYTSPQGHNKFIATEDERSRGKLKQTIKIIKYWRECRHPSIPLNTFHLELLLAKERTLVGKMSLAVCFHKALMLLHQRKCRALTDPIGISGFVKSANTEVKLEKVKRAVDSWTERTYKACRAEREEDYKEAFRLWNLVFNKSFPKA